MRTKDQLNQEYALECHLLGQIVYQMDVFEGQKKDILNKMRSLNEEAAELLPKDGQDVPTDQEPGVSNEVPPVADAGKTPAPDGDAGV